MYDYINYNQIVHILFKSFKTRKVCIWLFSIVNFVNLSKYIHDVFLYLYVLFQQDMKYRKMSFTIGFKNAFGIEILET